MASGLFIRSSRAQDVTCAIEQHLSNEGNWTCSEDSWGLQGHIQAMFLKYTIEIKSWIPKLVLECSQCAQHVTRISADPLESIVETLPYQMPDLLTMTRWQPIWITRTFCINQSCDRDCLDSPPKVLNELLRGKRIAASTGP